MRAGVLLLVSGLLTLSAYAQLNDVPQNHWAYQAIRELVRLRILQGFPDGTFQPNRQVTRAEFAQAIARAYRVIDERIRQLEQRIDRIAPERPLRRSPRRPKRACASCSKPSKSCNSCAARWRPSSDWRRSSRPS
jgi:hypothetical protein